MSDDLLGRHLPPVHMLNAPHLIGFQPYNIAVYTLNRRSSSVSASPVPAMAGATCASNQPRHQHDRDRGYEDMMRGDHDSTTAQDNENTGMVQA
jgi:hypothetical protein